MESTLNLRRCSNPRLKKALTQTPGRIWKVDPLIWGPILLRVLYRNPHEGICFLDPPGGLGNGRGLLDFDRGTEDFPLVSREWRNGVEL